MSHAILYLVHSAQLSGGAPLSLGYLLEQLDRERYHPIVACIHNAPDLLEFFRARQVEAFYAPGISIFPHTTGGWYSVSNPLGLAGLVKTSLQFDSSARATEDLVRQIKPALVHLNSLVLVSSAVGVKRAGAKLVWHVRESVHPGYFGLRRHWLESQVMRLADELVFISNDDRARLTHNRKGIVIPNFVDLARFDRYLDGEPIRRELGLTSSAQVVLFLGGFSRLKGAPILLRALQQVKTQIPNLHVVIASAIMPQSTSVVARAGRLLLPLLGGTDRQEFFALLEQGKMQEYVHLLPFRNDPERLIAASDLVVFPSTQPHFARPVIEAGAMAKPVVASKIGGVEELVDHEKTGMLVEPRNVPALTHAILRVLQDAAFAQTLGEGGYRQAVSRFSADSNVRQVMQMYARVLEKHA